MSRLKFGKGVFRGSPELGQGVGRLSAAPAANAATCAIDAEGPTTPGKEVGLQCNYDFVYGRNGRTSGPLSLLAKLAMGAAVLRFMFKDEAMRDEDAKEALEAVWKRVRNLKPGTKRW